MATTKKTTKRKTTKKKVAKKANATGVRIYEVARRLGTESATVLEVAASLNIPATNQMSTVTPEQAQRISDAFSRAEEPSPRKASKRKASKRKASKRKASKRKQTSTTQITIAQGSGNARLKQQCLTIIAGCGC